VLTAPIIPAINDHEIEVLLEAAADAGASEAHYVLLRLPLELRELFREWLLTHYPGKLRHVLSIVQSTRGGADYVAKFGERQVGTGVFAELIAKRFRLASERFGLKRRSGAKLRTDLFKPPVLPGGQMSLF
jgi:DNA repair photolyase